VGKSWSRGRKHRFVVFHRDSKSFYSSAQVADVTGASSSPINRSIVRNVNFESVFNGGIDIVIVFWGSGDPRTAVESHDGGK
jgi:hypothetical protein